MKKLKTNFLSRAPGIISSAVNLARGKNIETVVSHLSDLKGIPQKIGQMISMDFSQLFPAEIRDQFAPLQSKSTALDGKLIEEIIITEIGNDKFKNIEQFDYIAIGAGSIGQVHRAKIDKQDIVFKVQYPQILATINSDISLLKPFISIYEKIKPNVKDLSILINEAQSMLINEADYEKEFFMYQFFYEQLKSDARFLIPKTYDSYSTRKLICLEYVEGISLTEFIKENHSKELKKEISLSLLDLFIREFLEFKKVQTDPNFSNYLINKDNQIILLDFGAVKEYDLEFIKKYVALLKASYEKNNYSRREIRTHYK